MRLIHCTCFFVLLLAPSGCHCRCPFPGIPAHSSAWSDGEEITWQKRAGFQEGREIEFVCETNWKMATTEQPKIWCRTDGTWSGPLPRCDRVSDWSQSTVYTASYSGIANNSCFQLPADWWIIRPPYTGTFKIISQVTITTCPAKTRSDHNAITELRVDGKLCHLNGTRNDTSTYSCSGRSSYHDVHVFFTSVGVISNIEFLINRGDNCGWPPVPLLSDVTWNIPFGSIEVSHRCRSPTVPFGDGRIRCDPWTGQWSQPICTCPDPMFSYIKLIRRHHVTVEYECKSELKLTGSGTLTCDLATATGNWTQPNCSCSDPTLQREIVSRRTGNAISVTCPRHLELTGGRNITCDLNDGRWKTRNQWEDFSRCRCRKPLICFAAIDYLNDHSITVSCNNGRVISGNSVINCNIGTGTWGKLPECGCSDPPRISNAVWTRAGPSDGSYRCSEGFQMVGTSTIRCDVIANQWQFLPRCTCKDPTPVANATMKKLNDEAFTYQCDEGFEIIGSPNVTCDSKFGRWSHLPRCSCPTSRLPPQLRANAISDLSIQFSCPNQLEMTGHASCDELTGSWNTLPTCRCLTPLLPSKAKQSERTDFLIKLQCVDGFELMGNSSVNCNPRTGLWDTLPQCRCIAPETPDYAGVASRTENTIVFECKDNFKMKGKNKVNCDQNTGRWGPLPKCVCPGAPPTPEDATIATQDDHLIEFACNEGLKLLGNPKSICNASGHWTSPPVCQRPILLSVTVAGVSVVVVVLLIVVTACIARKRRGFCFGETISPTVDSSTDGVAFENLQQAENQLYANIIPLRVHEEPVYIGLTFENPSEANFYHRNRVESLYANVPDSASSRAVCLERPTEEPDVIYSSIRPNSSQADSSEPVYSQVIKSRKSAVC